MIVKHGTIAYLKYVLIILSHKFMMESEWLILGGGGTRLQPHTSNLKTKATQLCFVKHS